MNLQAIIAGLQQALESGAVSTSAVQVKLADGSLHQITEIDLILGQAEMAPLAAQVPAAYVLINLS